MTDTEVTWRILGHAYPQHFNKVVAETMWKNIEKVGLPEVERGGPEAREGAPERARGQGRGAQDGAGEARGA